MILPKIQSLGASANIGIHKLYFQTCFLLLVNYGMQRHKLQRTQWKRLNLVHPTGM